MSEHHVWHFNDVSRPADAVYIGRAMPRYGLAESPWRNPFTLASVQRQHPAWSPGRVRAWVLREYGFYVRETLQRTNSHWLDALAGKDLACWCAPKVTPLTADDPLVCHGQVLLRLIAEREAGG